MAEFKEFERRFKFKPRLKFFKFHLYSLKKNEFQYMFPRH